jgi:putative MATE family efflux protein
MQTKQEKRRDLILNGNIWKAIILLAVPVAMTSFIDAMYNLVDTYFVANIGNTELAAVGFVGPLNNLVRTISVGLTVGGTTLIAREIGRKDYDKAKNISLQLLLIAVSLGTLIAAIAFGFSKQILVAASATEDIMDIADIYFKITVLSSPFVFINSAYISIKRADGDTMRTMRVNIIAMVIKMVCTYIMIFHLDMGVKSLAISTIIGTMFVSIYAVYDLFIRESLLKLSLEKMGLTLQVIKAILIISIPIIIEKSSLSFSFIMMNKYVISFGEDVLVGYTITNRINSMFFATVTGFGVGLAPIVSQNLAINQDDRAKSAIKKTYLLAIGISIAIISVVLPLKYPLANVFAKDDVDVLYHTMNAMSVYSISVIPWAVFQVTSGIFQGTGRTTYNMIISIFRIYAFRLPIVIALINFTNLQEYSIWYGMLISNTLTGLVAILLYVKNRNSLKLVGE